MEVRVNIIFIYFEKNIKLLYICSWKQSNKYNMKNTANHFKTVVCAVLFSVLPLGNVWADELIRYDSHDIYACSESIIRNYAPGVDVVCVHDRSVSAGHPFFLAVKDTSNVSYYMVMGILDTVYDFEILKDTVYFCGKYSSSIYSGCAVVGYFDILSLMSSGYTTVSYLPITSMKTLSKLEVEFFASWKHLVAIGTDNLDSAVVMDATEGPTGWNICCAIFGNDSLRLTDIAFTDDYIVITSTKRASGMAPISGYRNRVLWWIEKTVMGPYYVPFNNVRRYIFDDGCKSYMVRARKDNEFVTVCNFMSPATQPCDYNISVYDGLNMISSYKFTESGNSMVSSGLLDISVDRTPGGKRLCVLLNNAYGNTADKSVIYDIPLLPTFFPTIIGGHVNNYNVNVRSLDYTGINGHFVASGIGPGLYYDHPYFLKYKFDNYDGDCFERVENELIDDSRPNQPTEKKVEKSIEQIIPVMDEIDKKELEITEKCNSSTDSDGEREKE